MSEKFIFNDMKHESAPKMFSWEMDEVTEWVTIKTMRALDLPSEPEETISLKTKRWSWHFGEENVILEGFVESL